MNANFSGGQPGRPLGLAWTQKLSDGHEANCPQTVNGAINTSRADDLLLACDTCPTINNALAFGRQRQHRYVQALHTR